MKKFYLIGLLILLVGVASFQYWQIQKQAPVDAAKKGKACADFGSPAKRRECSQLTGNTKNNDRNSNYQSEIVYQNGEYFDSAILPQYRTYQIDDCSKVGANVEVYYEKGLDVQIENRPGGVQTKDSLPAGAGFKNGQITGSFCGVVQVDGDDGSCSKQDYSGCFPEEEEGGENPTPSSTPSPSVSPSPSPSPSPSVSPSPSPSPSVSPSPSPSPEGHAVLVIRKFKDDDRDGNWDSNEGRTGREWQFQYRISADPWQDYAVPSDRDYGNGVDISLGTKVEVREIEQGGWTNTTGLTKIEILNDARTYYFDFGNFEQPGVTVTPPPSIVPQAGSGTNWLPLISLAAVGVIFQLAALLL
jgi:hypothetical protein